MINPTYTVQAALYADTTTSGPYLVTCIHQGYPTHAWFIPADSADIAAAIARHRYQYLTGVDWAETIRVTAYAELPEIMFGGEQTE